MSLEVGAGIKRQAEEGFLFRGWGQRMYFGAPTQCQCETGEVYNCVVKEVLTEGEFSDF